MKIKKYLLVSSLFIICSFFYLFNAYAGRNSGVDYKKRVEKLIRAAQQNDFKTIFEMDYWYQRDVSSIIKSTPKYRLDKKLEEYYNEMREKFVDQKTQDFKKEFSYNEVQNLGGNDIPILFLIKLFPKSCKWQILEINKEKEIAYISIVYASPKQSCKNSFSGFCLYSTSMGKHIRKTVAEISFSSAYFLGAGISDFKGDTKYWELPAIGEAESHSTLPLRTSLSPEALDRPEQAGEQMPVEYIRNLKKRIELIWKYPEEARREGLAGKTTIKFSINKSGKLEHVEILKSSGYKILDEAAQQASIDASPFWQILEPIVLTGDFLYSGSTISLSLKKEP